MESRSFPFSSDIGRANAEQWVQNFIRYRERGFYNGIIEQTNSYNHSIKLWMLAEKTYKLSQEQYQLSIQKFGYGKISVYELISTQKDQSAALQKYYQSINEAWNSYFNLRKATLYDFVSSKELEELFLKDRKP